MVRAIVSDESVLTKARARYITTEGYQSIANIMKAYGVNVTANQVKNKFDHEKREFKVKILQIIMNIHFALPILFSNLKPLNVDDITTGIY